MSSLINKREAEGVAGATAGFACLNSHRLASADAKPPSIRKGGEET